MSQTPAIQVHGADFYRALAEKAAAVPRRRQSHCLHTSQDAAVHRIFNAMQPDSYVQPHAHSEPTKDESVVVLQGRMGLLEFDAQGTVLARFVLGSGEVATIPAGVIHGWCCLAPDTVFFEAKAGPYARPTGGECATFAPAEGEPGTAEALARLVALATAEKSPVGERFNSAKA